MRSLSDEFLMGTFVILKPAALSRTKLTGGKFLASLLVVLVGLLPTLVFFLSIERLSGQGGIVAGATIGSYIGLLFLSAVFTAIGICCSSWTSNAVVAFIGAAFACFLLYSGFGAVSQLPVFAAGAHYFIENIRMAFSYPTNNRRVNGCRGLYLFFTLIFLFLI